MSHRVFYNDLIHLMGWWLKEPTLPIRDGERALEKGERWPRESREKNSYRGRVLTSNLLVPLWSLEFEMCQFGISGVFKKKKKKKNKELVFGTMWQKCDKVLMRLIIVGITYSLKRDYSNSLTSTKHHVKWYEDSYDPTVIIRGLFVLVQTIIISYDKWFMSLV